MDEQEAVRTEACAAEADVRVDGIGAAIGADGDARAVSAKRRARGANGRWLPDGARAVVPIEAAKSSFSGGGPSAGRGSGIAPTTAHSAATGDTPPSRLRRATSLARGGMRGGKRAGRTRAKAKRVQVRWSARREELFLCTLAETSKVCEAIRASGLSETNIYRKRRQSADFRAKWLAALREGYARLETMMLARALNGVEKPVYYGGKLVGTMMEYNDRTGLSLLRHHRDTVSGTREFTAEVPIEELRARLKAKLGEMNSRMGGAG
ncbi:hypothetical protein [Sphingomonas bacterium]|uniref:hypothetical protein n=1 Tax=Sphingomonas bacterium TaxID=1895847 RepID=UPI0015776D86|nr:hypothetical protein [Sphingomonas bacterium]